MVGLSEDFQAGPIVSKALRMLTPEVNAHYQYVDIEGKKVFAIKVDKMSTIVALQDQVYERVGASTKSKHSRQMPRPIAKGNPRLSEVSQQLESFRAKATDSMTSLIDHYQGVLKIIDDTAALLSAAGPSEPPSGEEGRILSRVIYSSFVDNFETFLSDLLFEVFLAKPDTLKSGEKVTLEEVLNCADLQEFVEYWSKHKVSKLQRGSVKGFIADNKQIRDLGIIDAVSRYNPHIYCSVTKITLTEQ